MMTSERAWMPFLLGPFMLSPDANKQTPQSLRYNPAARILRRLLVHAYIPSRSSSLISGWYLMF